MSTLEELGPRHAAEAFYTSFYVSQGERPDQHRLFDALAYKVSCEPASFGDIAGAAKEMDLDALMASGAVTLPKKHKLVEHFVTVTEDTTPEDIVAQTFEERWAEFRARLEEPMCRDKEAYHHSLDVLAGHMVERDLGWIARGRPNRRTPEEQYRSLYREHVLRGRTCGSLVVDAVLADMNSRGSMLPTTPGWMRLLATQWGLRFPDQAFMDAEAEGRLLTFRPHHLQ